MRDNGLPASQWSHLADVDPWIAHSALEALRDAGVPAYCVPHPGAAGAYLDVHLPDRPLDRLFVEVGTRERAGVVLAEVERTDPRSEEPRRDGPPGTGDRDVDARFAEIVAGLTNSPDERPRPRSPEGPPTPEAVDTPATTAPPRLTGWDDLLADEPRQASPSDTDLDAEDRFVPPPPPPIPSGTPVRRFAWAAVLGAPLIVVLSVLTDRPLDGWLGLFVVLAFLGGLGTLFATLRDGDLDDEDPDHGAVV